MRNKIDHWRHLQCFQTKLEQSETRKEMIAQPPPLNVSVRRKASSAAFEPKQIKACMQKEAKIPSIASCDRSANADLCQSNTGVWPKPQSATVQLIGYAASRLCISVTSVTKLESINFNVFTWPILSLNIVPILRSVYYRA